MSGRTIREPLSVQGALSIQPILEDVERGDFWSFSHGRFRGVVLESYDLIKRT